MYDNRALGQTVGVSLDYWTSPGPGELLLSIRPYSGAEPTPNGTLRRVRMQRGVRGRAATTFTVLRERAIVTHLEFVVEELSSGRVLSVTYKPVRILFGDYTPSISNVRGMLPFGSIVAAMQVIPVTFDYTAPRPVRFVVIPAAYQGDVFNVNGLDARGAEGTGTSTAFFGLNPVTSTTIFAVWIEIRDRSTNEVLTRELVPAYYLVR